MLKFLVVAVFVSAISAASVHQRDEPPRLYDPTEEDPLRIRYLPYLDANGEIQYEDLSVTPPDTRYGAADVTFYLYNKANSGSAEIIKATEFSKLVASSRFSPSRRNVFVSHGWNNNQGSPVNTNLKSAILSQSDVNLFIIDWSGPANKFYTTARGAVPAVGAAVGDWINQMMSQWGLSPAQFTLIGHSLGAHLAGCAGARVNGQVDTIVGLDPAGPLYTFDNTAVRIDPSDGAFVQIIHTNGILLGFRSAIGDMDLYPNGGLNQVGCGADLTGTCAHSRAYLYLAESIKSHGFDSRRCTSDSDYDNGKCNGNHASFLGRLDVHKSASGDYFLNTKSSSPFSL